MCNPRRARSGHGPKSPYYYYSNSSLFCKFISVDECWYDILGLHSCSSEWRLPLYRPCHAMPCHAMGYSVLDLGCSVARLRVADLWPFNKTESWVCFCNKTAQIIAKIAEKSLTSLQLSISDMNHGGGRISYGGRAPASPHWRRRWWLRDPAVDSEKLTDGTWGHICSPNIGSISAVEVFT